MPCASDDGDALTAYQAAMLKVIAAIPCGRVSTYGVVAKAAGFPGYARQVGSLLKTLPSGSAIPWHRVINSQGKISFPNNSERYTRQRQLLESEGVRFQGIKIRLQDHIWPD